MDHSEHDPQIDQALRSTATVPPTEDEPTYNPNSPGKWHHRRD